MMKCFELLPRQKGETQRVRPLGNGAALLATLFQVIGAERDSADRSPPAELPPRPPRKPLRTFRYGSEEVQAATRSEARGHLKKRLGLNRLPAHAQLCGV